MLLRKALFGLMLMAPDGDGTGGGGGGTPPAPSANEAALSKENADLKAKLAEYEKKNQPTPPAPPKDPQSLNDKVQADADEKKRQKDLESAIAFNYGSAEFLKNNESLLPKEIAEIFKKADAETYDTPVQKERAIKVAVVEQFFKTQENLDLLTTAHKKTFEDFLKLTVNSKKDEANSIYQNLFEPALESLRRQKKADEVKKSNSGFGTGDKGDQDAYRDKMIAASKKYYGKKEKS